MPEIILHHYPRSPFAEKVRLALGFKGLPWLAVEQPRVAPKPGLTALTGGYRRIPVMQVGADAAGQTGSLATTQIDPSPHSTGMAPAPGSLSRVSSTTRDRIGRGDH